MTAHRYWRCLNREGGASALLLCGEMELRESAGGSDATGSGTAIRSSERAGEEASKAFDNSLSFFWQCNIAGGDWLGYDFGSGVTKDIVEVTMQPLASFGSRMMREFDVQWSDDAATWTTLFSVTAATWTNSQQVFTKPAGGASRYWRMRSLKCMDGTLAGLGLYEIEMRTSVGGSDQTAPGGTITSRTNFTGWTAAQAIDNVLTAPGYSHGTSVNESEWLRYDFGVGVTKSIVEITILPRTADATSWMQAPTDLVVECGSDGISFVAAWTARGMLGDKTYTQRFIKPASVVATAPLHRFWGLRCSAVQGGAVQFGLTELWLYATVGAGSSMTTGGAGVSLKPYTPGGFSAALGFDSSNATEYGGQTLPDILAYDFGIGNEKAVPAAFKIRARSSGGLNNHNQSPTALDLVWSDDGWNWTTQESFTSPATWTASEERSFTVLSASARRRMSLL